MTYAARRAAHAESIVVRDLAFALHRWPGVDPHPALLVHGWGDTGATWQFLVDHLAAERTWLAMDLRGFGRTQRPADGYWFPDYLADLDALIDHLVPHSPVDLVSHSMGANIAMLYAGVRPERVRRLVSLEGFGLARTVPQQAPARYAQWLDELKHGVEFATYASFDQLIAVLARRNPRTPPERLAFIARSWARERPDGRVELWADPKHKRVNPVLYQRDQAQACWQAITAPLLLVMGEHSELISRVADELREERLRASFRNVKTVTLRGAGHMLHHERPQEVAALIDEFLA